MRSKTVREDRQITYFILPFIILIVSLVVRLMYYATIDSVVLGLDSVQYLDTAEKLAKFHLDVRRVPVYPLFIMIAKGIFSGYPSRIAILYLQLIISCLGLVILYFITLLLLKKRVQAFLITIYCSISICLINWDILVMSESIACFFVLLLVLFFLLYLKKGQLYPLVVVYGIHIILIFLRPFYLFLPFLTLSILLLRAIFNKTLKKEWFIHIIAIFVIYIFVASYSFANLKQNDYMGITDVSVVNSLGKVMQYKMYNLGKDEELKQELEEYCKEFEGDILGPGDFISSHNLQEDHYKRITQFVDEVIKGHPIIFMKNTMKLVVNELWKEKIFIDYNNDESFGNIDNYLEEWPKFLYEKINDIFAFNSFAMVFLMLLIELATLISSLLRHEKVDYRWLFISSLITYQLIMSILGSFDEYQRLMVPVDILIIILVFKNFFYLVNRVMNRRTQSAI